MQTETKKPWNWLLFPFSSIKSSPYGLFAASVGYGVYEIDLKDNWLKLDKGMPEQATVHRLQLQHDLLHACTSHGLYEWMGEHWDRIGPALSYYQYRKIGGTGYAASEDGLWSEIGSNWERIACENKRVYDFINLPQYLVIGHESGISLYDRFMDDWAHFELERSVTSLAVYRGLLIGASDKGELLIGDKKGGFSRIKFGRRFIFSIKAYGKDVYVCTDRGLFQLSYIRNQYMLLSLKLGYSVTDVDVRDGQLHMATLFQGIQSISV